MTALATTTHRFLLGVLCAAAALFALAPDVRAEGEIPEYVRWAEETVEQFKSLPIQEGGRIKPIEAYARVRLLRYHSRRSMKLMVGESGSAEKEKISATEWMLDVMFRPELARTFPTFIVNDSDAIIAIGVDEHTKRRSRYSYDEIFVGREKLSKLNAQYSQIEEEDRTGKENQIVDLARNVAEFEFINHMFDFARDGLEIDMPDVDPALAGGAVPVSTFFSKMDAVQKAAGDPGKREEMTQALNVANGQMGLYLATARLFGFSPPEDEEEDTWLLPSDLMERSLNNAAGAGAVTYEISQLEMLESLGAAEPLSAEFKTSLDALHRSATAAMVTRGEGGQLGTELLLYRGKFYGNTQAFLIFGFLLMALGLLSGGKGAGKVLQIGGVACAVVALVLLVVWLTLRCVIMGRPPVANLYETVLFIVAVIMLLALAFHIFSRDRPFVLTAALFVSSMGIYISMLYDRMKGEDTMGPLVAVLNSNFWLATHVTIVTMGYAAGLLAAANSHVYIFAKLFRLGDKDFLRDVTRKVYAVVCFTLLFSLVGTILGGIWANVSWGRFWGWDPKENGALLIVLASLAILHARLGGHIRQDGVHFASIVLGMIVAFSWWYVNVMGVGLHNYGFTSGIKKAVWIFWLIEIAVIIFGIIAWKRGYGDPRPRGKGQVPAKAVAAQA